jgi:hypothetical protein
MVAVLMPYPEPADGVASPVDVSPRLTTLAGRTIGIVNNSWHCMDVVTEELRAALYADYAVGEVVEVKISAAQTLPVPELERLAATCDAVVVGIGTCGSCSRWVLHDAMELERHTVPTVSLFTKVFEQLARTVRDHEGFPGLPLAILPHPLNPLPDDQIRAAANAAVREIAGSLTDAGTAAR